MGGQSRRTIKFRARKRLAMLQYIGVVRFVLFFTAVTFVVVFTKSRFTIPIEGALDLRGIMIAYLSLSPAEWTLLGMLLLLDVAITSPLQLLMSGLFLKMTNADAMERKAVDENGVPLPPEREKLGEALKWTGGHLSAALTLGVQIAVRKGLWWVLFCCPAAALLYFEAASQSVCSTLLLVGACTALLMEGRYFPAFFYLATGDGVSEALRHSKRSMRRRLGDYFVYNLSFFWWNILVALSFGIAIIFVVPYRGVCDALYVRQLDAESREVAV